MDEQQTRTVEVVSVVRLKKRESVRVENRRGEMVVIIERETTVEQGLTTQR